MPSFTISLPDSPIEHTNQAAHDNQYDPSDLQLSSRGESKSEHSSSSKTMSKASTRKEEHSTEAQQEKEKRSSSETPEEKKKRRQEEKEKRSLSETPEEKKKRRQERRDRKEKKEKSRKERALAETTEEEKKRSEEKKEKKRKKKEKKEKESKTRSNNVPEALESRSSESREDRRSASTVGRGVNSTQGCEDSSVCAEYEDNNSLTEMSLDEQKLLRHKVKTLSCQLETANEKIRQLDDRNARMSDLVETANEKIRQLDDRNARMSDLAVQLLKTEEELEYTTEENNEYSTRVVALEQALISQETELDNALTAMRQNDPAKQEREILQETQLDNALTAIRQNDQANRERDLLETEEATNSFASEEGSAQWTIIRKELKAVRGELEQSKHERDMAVDKTTKVSIRLAELQAETDESRGKLTESQALIAQMRALWQLNSPSSAVDIKRAFFWSSKKDDKPTLSSNDDLYIDAIDATEDNTSVSSEDWSGRDEMDHHERRRHEEAST
jgi:hypothetical protein